MPTYEYECHQCHERVEAVQKFADPTLTVCPLCAGELRKVFSSVGIVFKGSGFYKNDSRGSAPKTTTPSAGSATDASSATPAATPTPASAPSTPAPSTPSSL
ncbi:MAG: FmdB family zinc ribbon protein [Acidimicrobiales bacterium]